MRITVPAADEAKLRTALRGYFGIVDECDDQPSARVTRSGGDIVAEADENALGFEAHIRGLYANIKDSFPTLPWEAAYPELLS